MPHDYRLVYRRGLEVLEKVKWRCDPEGMFRPPSLAKGRPVWLECERLAAELGVPVLNVCEEVVTAARIHHFVTICGREGEQYFLSGHCPLDGTKLGKLSRRMPPFIRAKLKTLIAGSVNVVSNPDHAFDTDGWAELTRRLPKFRATMEYYAAHCTGTPIQLVGPEIDRLSEKLQSIQHECDLIEQKLKSIRPKEKGTSHHSLPMSKSKTTPTWLKAYRRVSLVYGVLQKTNRDLNSKFWKPEWMPTEAQWSGVSADLKTMSQAAATIHTWLHR